MVPLRYGDEVLQYVAVLELGGGRIRRGMGAPFPAQPSRAAFADPG
jgi:hypothetical protein